MMSLPARLMNVFAIPGEVFSEVKAAGPSVWNWLAPALMLLPISWFSAWLIFSQPSIQQQLSDITEQALQKQIEKGHLTQDQIDMQRKAVEMTSKIMPYVAPVFMAFVSPFLWGLILWLVGTKALKGKFPFMKGVEVAGLANTIGVLQAIVTTLLIISFGNLFASASPALLVRELDLQKPSHSLLATANVMTFWLLTVRSVGLARLSGASVMRAGVWVFGIWAAYTSAAIGLGTAVRAMTGK
jgi:hypothetical protein